MDKIKEISDIVIELNKFEKKVITDYEFIQKVCAFFDEIKDEKFTTSDIQFLEYIANKSGVPMFFDMLKLFKHNLKLTDVSLSSLASFIYEGSLFTSDNIFLHKYQNDILTKYDINSPHRFLLTASTSFGKTFLVYEIIRKMKYKNILLVFPSIALLSENLERILTDQNYLEIKKQYKIHTLSEIPDLDFGENNIFIFTPERYISFLEKHNTEIKFDFVFIDEIYKIDNEFEIDEEMKENERDVAYRLATFFATKDEDNDILLAGPYLIIKNPSFRDFLKDRKIIHLDYNKYEIVNKHIFVGKGRFFVSDKGVSVSKSGTTKLNKILNLTETLLKKKENLIIYCSNRGKNGGVEFYASKLLKMPFLKEINNESFNIFLEHIKNRFSPEWIVYKSLCKGIGIHHGLIPKYIQKEIIRFFNLGFLKILISTTTITEGVNTSAKNLIVTSNSKGSKDLKVFDAKNIAGRAGRLNYHYSGNIFEICNGFKDLVLNDTENINHKNYEKNLDKSEIDVFITKDDFLTSKDKVLKETILHEQEKRKIPDDVINQYKVINRLDKIKLYDIMVNFTCEEFLLLAQTMNSFKSLNKDGFQLIFNSLLPIINNKELNGMIEKKDKNGKYSIVIHYLSSFYSAGLKGVIAFKLNKNDYDTAVNQSTKFVFNILKYQIVKYLGVFNIFYKYLTSKNNNKKLEEINGLDRIIRYFEYNAFSDKARIISDYGVPERLVRYYDQLEIENEDAKRIKNSFDDYEIQLYEKTQRLVQ